jgi:hypothetical protein
MYSSVGARSIAEPGAAPDRGPVLVSRGIPVLRAAPAGEPGRQVPTSPFVFRPSPQTQTHQY